MGSLFRIHSFFFIHFIHIYTCTVTYVIYYNKFVGQDDQHMLQLEQICLLRVSPIADLGVVVCCCCPPTCSCCCVYHYFIYWYVVISLKICIAHQLIFLMLVSLFIFVVVFHRFPTSVLSSFIFWLFGILCLS